MKNLSEPLWHYAVSDELRLLLPRLIGFHHRINTCMMVLDIVFAKHWKGLMEQLLGTGSDMKMIAEVKYPGSCSIGCSCVFADKSRCNDQSSCVALRYLVWFPKQSSEAWMAWQERGYVKEKRCLNDGAKAVVRACRL